MTERPKVAVQHLDDEMHEWLLIQRQTKAYFDYTLCDWCQHGWHAEACARNCRCDTSRQRRDDTWRPPVTLLPTDMARRIGHDTGCDGYAAQFCTGRRNYRRINSVTLRDLLYGKGRD